MSEHEAGAQTNDLLVGIDFGTSITAISTSRGARAAFDSAVGYPKDLVGVRLLGATEVIGADALGKRTYLNVIRPLENGVIKESGTAECDAAKKLMAHAVSLAEAKDGDRVCAVIGVPAAASNLNKEFLLDLAKDVVDTALVVSEPFMVGYGLGLLEDCLVIDIGAGTTDLCALKGTIPDNDDQAGVPKAGDFIDALLHERIGQRYPDVQLTIEICKSLKEQHGFVGASAQPVVVELRADGKPVNVDITAELQAACSAILPDILEHARKLIAGFDPAHQTAALSNVLIAGGGAGITGIAQAVADGLAEYGEVEVRCINDPVYAGADGALKLATELPPTFWNEVGAVI